MKIKKKIWLKYFSKKEFKLVLDVFKRNSPYTDENWERIKFTKMIRKNGQFVHMESDIADNSLGILPKQIKNCLDKIGIDQLLELLENTLPIFNSMLKDGVLTKMFSDSGFINWEMVWAYLILDKDISNQDDYTLHIGQCYVNLMSDDNGWKFGSCSDELLRAVGKGQYRKSHFRMAIDSGIISKNFNRVELFHFGTDALEKRYALKWKKIRNYIPKSKHLLRANPENFCKKTMNAIGKIYGTTKLGELSHDNERNASLLIDNFGINLEAINLEYRDETLFLNGREFIFNLNFGNKKVRDIRPFLRKVSKMINSFDDITSFISCLNRYPVLEKYVTRKDKISLSEEKTIRNIVNLVVAAPEAVADSLKSISPEFIKMLYKNDPENEIAGVDTILALIKIFDKYKNVDLQIPIVKGEVGKYTFEILKKSDPLGLTLGYATDCCQVIGGEGESCLVSGYKEETSSFFVIKKNGKVFSQSWVWEKTNRDGKRVFAFDSIEILGKNSACSQDVIKCYENGAKELSKHYDIVFASADGSVLPDGIFALGRLESYDYLEGNPETNYAKEKDLECPYDNVYSDVDRTEKGLIIIKEE